MEIKINNEVFSSLKDIPSDYECEPKTIYIDSEEDSLDVKKLKNVNSVVLSYLEKSIKVLDLSNLNELESLHIYRCFNLQQIIGIDTLPNLKLINYPGHEYDYDRSLLANIIQQLDIKKLLDDPSSHLLLSVFAIPMLRKKYPDFFTDFSEFSSKISFGDYTEKFLRDPTFSTCTFEDARQVELIIDEWISENISSEMNNIEVFSRIYEYVLNIDYDFDAAKDGVSEVRHIQACSLAKVLLNKKGICVGYSQVLKYIALKCGLMCEYVQACARHNYDIQSDGPENYVSVFPKEIDKSKLSNFIIPNHAIVRFSPDCINWLYSDATHDSLFTRTALEKNKILRDWPNFCLPKSAMEVFNALDMHDLNLNKLTLPSELTKETSMQLKIAIETILNSKETLKRIK